MNRLVLQISAALFLLGSMGCANLCARKDKFFQKTCGSTSVSYRPDPTCEAKIENCSDVHLAQLEGYVKCLEATNECSLEAIGKCGQMYPGGVNLMCEMTP
ncbi:MAG: hypothetical protein HYV07_23600 [Deltaproteobacteria bacterium]|nr:hypothetical protein [Deltaproteobacteria bacterium]